MRVGERALDCVILPPQRRPKRLRRCLQDFEPAPTERGYTGVAPDEVQRSAAARARLRKQQSAVGEIERRESDPAGNRGTAAFPPQPARDH